MHFRPDDTSSGATTLGKTPATPAPQVLVVDDVGEIRELITGVLRADGYRVLEAEDGLAAQLILLSEHPSLVISDLEMPVCDGWALLAFCHAQRPEMPVLILSGSKPGERPEIERWAAGFLPKPFTIEQFHADVRRLISRAA